MQLVLLPGMKLLAGLLAASLLGFVTQPVESQIGDRTGNPAPTDQARALHSDVASARMAVAEPPAPVPAAPRSWTKTGAPNKVVLIPNDVCESSDDFDVMVHFHGVPVTTEPIVHRANLSAVVVIVNWGIGSGAYEDKFQGEGSLCTFLDGIERSVKKACPSASGKVGRVALSAWSAGYGAVYRILFHEKDAERVDSVLLSDGLHVGYVGYRKVNPLQMEGFTRFAERAARGEKLFAITHSDVTPFKYASTTETAEFLLESQGVKVTKTNRPGPLPKMTLTSTADKAGLHMRGFSGGTVDDHSNHLRSIGDTLWSHLRDRWSARLASR
ncbi:MAG TPA: hypothetical protein VK524_03405 [Polyangiaceae bacterium]|nr:hypothetical protein [Polyangiaceae bacterium]